LLLKNTDFNLCIVGSEEDRDRVKIEPSSKIKNFCGKLDLRQSAALVSTANFVVTNSSLCMHLSGAFKIPSLTLLGDWYNSTKLHSEQWGYPEGIVMGKEKFSKQTIIATVQEAYKLVVNSRGYQTT
jgi:ADP-heptose:LPS heptosyltransferase